MKMLNRYVIVLTDKGNISQAISNIKKLGGIVVSVSCSNSRFLIMYKAEEEIAQEQIMDWMNQNV